MEQLLLPVHKDRHQCSSCTDADHGNTRLGLRRQAVYVADPVSDGRSFGKNQQIVPLLQNLDGGADGADVVVPPADGERPHLFQQPAQEGILEQLFLGHDVQSIIDGQAEGHQDGIPVAGVVWAEEHPAFRKLLHTLYRGGMEHAGDEAHDIVNQNEQAVEGFHRPVLSRMISSSASRLCRKSSAEVSSSAASSARRRGAASR